MPSAIHGFEEAVALESFERNTAYLELSSVVCGVSIRQMTPMDVARLGHARNPFISGGVVTYAAIAQFLFLLRSEVESTDSKARNRIASILKQVTKFDLDAAHSEVSEYIEITYRDSPSGTPDSAPVATSTAWLEYRMAGAPWGWKREETMRTSLRIIFQQIRCKMRADGETVVNKLSGTKKDEFLCEVDRRFKEGTLTQSDLDRMNEASLRARFGDDAVNEMRKRDTN